MSRLLDKRRADGTFPFEYRSSAATDLRETFERIRKQQQARTTENLREIKPRIKTRAA